MNYYIWMGYWIDEVYKCKEKRKLSDLYGEKIIKTVTEPNILDSGVIFLCESGKRVFYRVGREFKADRDFIVKCGMFSSEEILWYDEAQRVKKKELKERRCERDRKELEILKKRLGEC